ncbi:HNH endonuclease [Methanolobus sp. ZRKC5]|uniref:HNH endonuclease n=1 Tax=unclassified Methanolobus TaxID=2629569 RepID=UPI00313E85F8
MYSNGLLKVMVRVNWTNDEQIIALYYYLKGAKADKNDKLVNEIYHLLPNGHSLNSVALKVGNFRYLDPSNEGGLKNVTKSDIETWDKYFNNFVELEKKAKEIIATLKKQMYTDLPNPIEAEAMLLPEGSKTTISVNVYERNPKARKACIDHYGTKCHICGFDFEKVYGLIGDGFIEVHHKVPVSEIGESYQVNPIEDLIPVCSNCHSMLHRKKDRTMEVNELKQILNQ